MMSAEHSDHDAIPANQTNNRLNNNNNNNCNAVLGIMY
jgi:hypothetical protein